MNNAEKIVDEIANDLSEGFEKIDRKYISTRPPKIKWGNIFMQWSLQKRYDYLMKFGEAMNHAASLVQKERDDLGKLCEQKESQLIKLNEMMRQNNEMLQQEVTRFNEQRQKYNKEIAHLNSKIRELENGNKC
jgi:hypothetical protein